MRKSNLWVGLLLFGVSLLVKLPYLGTFLTIDERRWIGGAGQFFMAVRQGDLAQTYWHFFPGITITWGQALVLWLQSLGSHVPPEAFVGFQMEYLAQSVGAMRLSGVVLTSLAVPFVYWLGKPLLGKWPALLAAGLLAVDPFWVAHSRVVNGDALAGVLIVLAYLAFALLLFRPEQKWAVISGLFVGLSLLTKLPAPVVVPCIGLLAAIGIARNRNWRFWLRALIFCGATSAVVFVVLWPAMWVSPLETLRLIYVDTFDVGDIGGKDKVEFFMGQVVEKQSPFFYPLALAFRLTPVNMLGAVLTLPLVFVAKNRRTRWAMALLWLFMVIVTVLGNFSPKKADRYLMSVVVAVDVLAAVGWVWLAGRIGEFRIANGRTANEQKTMNNGQRTNDKRDHTPSTTHYAPRTTSHVPRPTFRSSLITHHSSLIPAFLIAIQLMFTITNYPYVLTYYNPLLGGFATAAELVPVGRGEGLEQAAAWINSQPNGQAATITPYYENVTNFYLDGTSLDWPDDGKKQLLADYVVFYIAQTQRKLPYPGLVDYFQQQEPAYVVRHGQTPYVWVYKRQRPIKALSGEAEIVGRAQIVGYSQTEPRLTPGSSSQFVLYLLTKDQPLPPNEDFRVSLIDASGNSHGQWQSAAVNRWTTNGVVEWRGQLALSPRLPPGNYKLKVSLIDTNINAEVTFFPFDEETITVYAPKEDLGG